MKFLFNKNFLEFKKKAVRSEFQGHLWQHKELKINLELEQDPAFKRQWKTHPNKMFLNFTGTGIQNQIAGTPCPSSVTCQPGISGRTLQRVSFITC